MDPVSEVKARLNIEDVIGEYVQLKRSGRNFKGLSPWTNEKTPSFMVSPEKNIWHDFSSGKGGDLISFVMEMEGLDFRAALQMLARRAGLDLEQFSRPVDRAANRAKIQALRALELAAKFYQAQLKANQTALKYLIKDRRFSKQTLLDWRLGYSPDGHSALIDFLGKRGFDIHEIKLAGLATERAGRVGDMFRGRVMIPLDDSRGRVIGFTARTLKDEPNAPKYINTPQTLLYDKSRHVFGLHLAKEGVRKAGYVVVVEGNLDVIASRQAGVKNVVASAGTAITDRHLQELKRFTGDVRLCFDADRAGLEATERAIPLAQKVGVDLSIINIKDAKDADELIKKKGTAAWQAAIDGKVYAPDWVIERYQQLLDLESAQGKREFANAVLAVVRRLGDKIEQDHYLKKIAELTEASLESVRDKFNLGLQLDEAPRRKIRDLETLDRAAVEYQKLQYHFLAILFFSPAQRQLLDGLRAQYFTEGAPRQIFEFLVKTPDYKGGKNLPPKLRGINDYVKIMVLQFEELYQSLPAADLAEQAASLKQRLVEKYVKTEKSRLAAEMEKTHDNSQLQKLIRQADKLNELLRNQRKVE